jgi:hypothetical protein
MKILSNELKRILTGLAYQDAGEFLSMGDKMKVLGYGPKIREKPLAASRKVVTRPATKAIALISDGRGLGAPLDYAIDACLRQDARIDLLVHGVIDMESISVLEKRIQEAGLDCHRIQLGARVVDGIVEYICNHPSLIFLVAMPDDAAARVLIEEVIPKRGGRIPVPLVLIEDQLAAKKYKQSAA